MSVKITPMTPHHYEQVLALWHTSEGIGLSAADSPAAIARYLDRNPDLSFVAYDGETLVGAVLCGHDGRRGFIHHLAVAPSHRRVGVGRALVERCLSALHTAGIDKCHLFVFASNHHARAFWQATGWFERPELVLISRYTNPESPQPGKEP